MGFIKTTDDSYFLAVDHNPVSGNHDATLSKLDKPQVGNRVDSAPRSGLLVGNDEFMDLAAADSPRRLGYEL